MRERGAKRSDSSRVKHRLTKLGLTGQLGLPALITAIFASNRDVSPASNALTLRVYLKKFQYRSNPSCRRFTILIWKR